MSDSFLSSQNTTFRLTVAARMANYKQRAAARIYREREARGWRREELANRTGISFRQIERWEGAKSYPQLANRMALAEAFGVELTDLFPVEAEEADLLEQLARIETKVEALMRNAGIDLTEFDTEDMDAADRIAAEIEAAASSSIELLAGKPAPKPPAKRAPARKRQAG